MSKKRPRVEIVVPRKMSEAMAEDRGFLGNVARIADALADVIDSAKRPGGVRAEIQMGADGPEVRVHIPEQNDAGHVDVHSPAEPPEGYRTGKPPAKRVARGRQR